MDRQYACYTNSPWSPKLHQTFLEHCYWQTELTQKRTCRNFKHVLDSIRAQLETPPPMTGSISHNLRQTQHKLQEIRCKATAQREAYLNNLAEAASNANDKTKQKLILHLHTAEQEPQMLHSSPQLREATVRWRTHKTASPQPHSTRQVADYY